MSGHHISPDPVPRPVTPPLKPSDARRSVAPRRAEEWDRPEHYGGEEDPFEPIKIIEHYDLNFNLGNAVKYILRAGKKPGQLDSFEDGFRRDLKKAYTYIGFEIRRRERERET